MTISMDATDPSADVEIERRKFEARWKADGWPQSAFRLDGSGFYTLTVTQAAFNGWLAKARDKEKGL
jgi:hypothetical protein